jgi:hypothetical protein
LHTCSPNISTYGTSTACIWSLFSTLFNFLKDLEILLQ